MDYGQPGDPRSGYYREQGFSIPIAEFERMQQEPMLTDEQILDMDEWAKDVNAHFMEEFIALVCGTATDG